MILKRFEDITFSDIQALKDNAVAEGKTIEYKVTTPSNADSDKVKFIAGISALANTTGGDFICGIKEVDGVPVDLPGLQISNVDAEKLRLEDILRNGIEPRLPGFEIKYLQSDDGRGFFVIRVRQSWIAPHKVKANEKFYARTSAGKYPLDVSELRTAFMLTEQLSERIKKFREERVRIVGRNHEIPATLINGGKIILHALPLASFTTQTEFDVMDLRRETQFESTRDHERKINLEGIVIAPYFEKVTKSYTQIFRNGCIERVVCLNSLEGFREDKDYSSRYDEEQIIEALSEYIDFYSKIGMELPIYLFLTFIDITNYEFHIDDEFHTIIEIRRKTANRNKIVFERNELWLREIIISDYKQSSREILRPTFNLVWNSVGLSRDFNYDKNGNWIEDPRSLSQY